MLSSLASFLISSLCYAAAIGISVLSRHMTVSSHLTKKKKKKKKVNKPTSQNVWKPLLTIVSDVQRFLCTSTWKRAAWRDSRGLGRHYLQHLGMFS